MNRATDAELALLEQILDRPPNPTVARSKARSARAAQRRRVRREQEREWAR